MINNGTKKITTTSDKHSCNLHHHFFFIYKQLTIKDIRLPKTSFTKIYYQTTIINKKLIQLDYNVILKNTLNSK